MSSPRTTWSGLIKIGLFNAPVTIAKATDEKRERSIKDVCAKHKCLLDRSERCSKDNDCDLDEKSKGVEMPNGEIRIFNANEFTAIEDATKSEYLEVLDVQPVLDLPLHLSLGAYYVRADAKTKGADNPVSLLEYALRTQDYALIVKWGNATRERLAVIHSNDEEILVLNVIPFLDEIRQPGDQEIAHMSLEVDPQEGNMMIELLRSMSNENGFEHESYEDEGFKRRSEAVDKILGGEKLTEEVPEEPVGPSDTMAMLEASMAAMKQ